MEVLHAHCAGLNVHKDTVVACVRHMAGSAVKREIRTFKTTTKDLMALSDWLSAEGCTDIAMEATGVYWKPVWHVLSDGDDDECFDDAVNQRERAAAQIDEQRASPDVRHQELIKEAFRKVMRTPM